MSFALLVLLVGGLIWPGGTAGQIDDSGERQAAQLESVPAQQTPREAKPGKQPGVAVSIRALADEVRFGDTIPVEFTIRNLGKKSYEYFDSDYDLSGGLWEYQLVVQTETGETVPQLIKIMVLTGAGVIKRLPPGGHFTKTINVNEWVIIRAPGRYRLTGVYAPMKLNRKLDWGEKGFSEPIWITVKPRTPEEMRAYISGLQRRLEAAAKPEEQRKVVEQLAYSCSPEIVPILLDSWYRPEAGFFESQALIFYVPWSEEIKRQIMAVAARRGLADGMQNVLDRYGISSEEMFPLIERSLAEDNPSAWPYGALAAQIYAHDALTPRLIALATDPQNPARLQALHALALNRTDDSVTALKEFLNGPDEKFRKRVADAIRSAYLHRGYARGRPLLKTDFEERFQRPD